MSSVSISDEPPSTPLQPSSPSPSLQKLHLETYRSNRARLYPNVTDEQWNDWKWQQKNRVTTLEQIQELFGAEAVAAERMDEIFELYRTAITPYYLCLIDFDDPRDPLRVQSVPSIEELVNPGELVWDPLNEEGDSPVTGIVHRYPDRCLFLVTSYCPLYCRYCTRKRKWVDEDGTTGQRRIEKMIEYVAEHPEIRDVIVSGGDPLSLSLTYLEKILAGLRAIPHVEIIRFGSRVPVFLPQRIDAEMCALLEKYHPIWINTHFNHPNEITPESAAACDRLLRAGVPVNNQAVLLRGVNDCPYTMRDLVQGLMKIRVRPYYLYLCDQVMGAEHFRTSVGEGIEIIEFLRGHTSGLAVPQFVMDAPGGGGKIPLMPNYVLGHYGDSVVYRNFEGVIGRYDDVPSARHQCDRCEERESFHERGVAKLLNRTADRFEPQPVRDVPRGIKIKSKGRADNVSS
ncbi:MAG TPA: KamA family radical SAM protein [Thermoanaerobaculia bacterium]|nr:KamA family radical SAM protein [Thermoanaerobaculia bacterium]